MQPAMTLEKRRGAARRGAPDYDPLEEFVTWHFVHPDEDGHALAAKMLAEELPRRLLHRSAAETTQHPAAAASFAAATAAAATASASLPAPAYHPAVARGVRLPAPLYPEAAAGIDAPWRCQMCDWVGCSSLLPIAGSAVGFTMRSGGGVNVHDGQVAKFGWLGRAPGARIAFHLDGGRNGARVHLAIVCSHHGVGNASVALHRMVPRGATAAGPSAAAGGGGGGVGEKFALVAHRRVQARWGQRSTQQCIVPIGTIGPGAHTLTLQVEGEGESPATGAGAAPTAGAGIKVFGIYAQERRRASASPGAPPSLVQGIESF